MSLNYNEMFDNLQALCDEENCCNAFRCITLEELKEINYLFDRLLLFCEDIDEDELEDYECGDKVLRLCQLVDTLFTRDLRTNREE